MENPDNTRVPSKAISQWQDTFGARGDARFSPTRWTLIAQIQEEDPVGVAEAMDQLCRSYWYPLYAYVRRSGVSREEAEDLTQEFFTRLIEKNTLAFADREKGKLRTFLLTVMKRFLINEWKQSTAKKRGGGRQHLSINFDEGEDRYCHEPVEHTTPEDLYEKQWATTVLGRVMETLRLDYAGREMSDRYEVLKEALWWNSNESSYAILGEKLGMKKNAVKQAVFRLRKQYRTKLREEICGTLDTDDEAAVKEELQYLIRSLRDS